MVRLLSVVLPVVLLALTVTLPGQSQEKPEAHPPRELEVLPTENTYGKRFARIETELKNGHTAEALGDLQAILNEGEDIFVPVTLEKEGKQTTTWQSAHDKAESILAALPGEAQRAYEDRYASSAAIRFPQAVRDRDLHLMAEIVRRFRFTSAGRKAELAIATHQFDQGNYYLAARSYERLAARGLEISEDGWKARDLFHAAAAFHLAGETANEEPFWKAIPEANRADLRKELEQLKPVSPAKALTNWPLYRGDPARDAQGVGGPASQRYDWVKEISRDPQTMDWVRPASNVHIARGLPVLPAFFPVALMLDTEFVKAPLLLYRNYYGVQAVDVRTGELKWDSHFSWTLDKMARDHKKMPYLQQWITQWMQASRPNALWENSVTGTLSTDGRDVYVVEDLQVPHFRNQNPYGGIQPQPYGGDPSITEAIQHSELNAYDLRTGKIQWHLGGAGEKKDDPANELRDSYFLGPPLPLNNRLYVLIEKRKQLRLVCLDSRKNPERENPVGWSQALSEVPQSLEFDSARRMRAVSLAFTGGILVCPTETGAIFGIDPLMQRILWSRIYADRDGAEKPKARPPVPQPGLTLPPTGEVLPLGEEAWKVSAPVIVGDRIVFTALDDRRVHCIRLKDGAPVWTAPRADDDLYLAGVWSDKVLIVTKRSVRALNLTDGKPAWKELETGLPSGQGTAANDLYYLPLEQASATKKPEICVLDVKKGAIVAHQPVKEAPGNLLFFNKLLISQSLRGVEAFPLAKEPEK